MKPDLASLRMAAPNAPESLLEQHLRRLDDDYYERFDLAAIAAHVTQLGKLSRLLPAAVLVEPAADGQTACTLLTYDEPGLFSVATGILMSLGFSITAGAAYTYGRVPPRRTHGAETRRLVVDTFVGHVAAGPTPDWVTALEQRLRSTVGLVERRGADGLDAAQRQVNEWVTERLQQVGARRPASPFATDVAIDQLADGATRLTVESEDTPAFLYSLSAALALYGVSVRRVRIATHGQRVHDELDVELPPASEATTVREQLRIAVLLTKQFTYFLDSAADPYAALSRFGWLASHVLGGAERAEWLALLAEPRAMPSLAALLGASDFLWEDFVRPHSSELLHILQRRLHSAAEAEPPLADVLQARPTREQRAALVAYRDRQALLIQADGIFDEDPDPRPLSRRLTSLAEELLRGAIQIVTAELGPPLAVRFGVFALGKFGARALGYASDLELLLVHDGSDAQPYFGELLEGVQTLFRGKQQGLFELDLRLRPWGKNAALACPLGLFESYYGPGGQAHSLELLALTRLRPIAGEVGFGAEVVAVRDRLVYRRPWLDLEELAETRARQFRQKDAGTRNAKYSPGALVDLEYGVQILQVQHGGGRPTVRTPDLEAALRALAAEDVLDRSEADQLADAYLFFRRLINALRMLRGVAEDLELPGSGTAEARHLARRMGMLDPDWSAASEALEQEFAAQTRLVRDFVQGHIGEELLPGRH